MSTYPEEFSQLEKRLEQLETKNKRLKEALEGIFWYAKNRHTDIHIESYREAIKQAEQALKDSK